MPSPWLLLLLAISAEVPEAVGGIQPSGANHRGADGLRHLHALAGGSAADRASWRHRVVLIGMLAYNQMPSPAQLMGMGLITAGVVIVNLSGSMKNG